MFTGLKQVGPVSVVPAGEDTPSGAIMETSYYNTTHSKHPQLTCFETKAKSQEEKILEWFVMYDQPGSPSQLCRLIYHNAVPLTSIRRAMTNLTNHGKLVKTNKQIRSPYGRPEYQWKLAPFQPDLF
jgi:hypothetical protein